MRGHVHHDDGHDRDCGRDDRVDGHDGRDGHVQMNLYEEWCGKRHHLGDLPRQMKGVHK